MSSNQVNPNNNQSNNNNVDQQTNDNVNQQTNNKQQQQLNDVTAVNISFLSPDIDFKTPAEFSDKVNNELKKLADKINEKITNDKKLNDVLKVFWQNVSDAFKEVYTYINNLDRDNRASTLRIVDEHCFAPLDKKVKENEMRIKQLENARTFPAENLSFAGEVNDLFDVNMETGQRDNLFIENSMGKVNESIIGTHQLTDDGAKKLYVLMIKQNRLKFTRVRRILNNEELNKYKAYFSKVIDNVGNIAYEIERCCSNFNMEKFISGKLLIIKRNFKANKANSGKKGDYFYTLKYNNKQIQFRRHSNLDRSRFLFKNFYIDFMEDVYSLYLNKREFRSKKNKSQNRNRNFKNIKQDKQRNNDNTYSILKKLVSQISTLTRPNRPPYSNNGYNRSNIRRSNFRSNTPQLRGNRNVQNYNPFNGRRQTYNNNNRNFIRTSRY